MRRLLAIALLASAHVFAAGSVTEAIMALGPSGNPTVGPTSSSQVITGTPTAGNYVLVFQWTGDASNGSVPLTAFTGLCDGVLLKCTPAQGSLPLSGFNILAVETSPGSPAPTNNYTVKVLDGSGTDILGGTAAGTVSSANGQAWSPAGNTPPITAAGLSLSISGQSVASAKGTVYVFIAANVSRGLGVATSGSTGGSITLTTLGTSGASTLIAGVLNIPIYPTITLTTSGTSGAATLVGGVLNVPVYAGAVSNLTTSGTSGAATLVAGVLNIPVYSGASIAAVCNTTISTTTLTALATATSGAPCIQQINDNVYTFTSAPNVVISAAPSANGSYTLYLSTSGGVEMQISSAAGGTYTPTFIVVLPVTTPAFPDGSIHLATGTVTASSTSWTTVVDARAQNGQRDYISAGTGIAAVINGLIGIDSTVPQKGATNMFTGTNDYTAGNLLPPSGSSLPGTCTTGQSYRLTSAPASSQWYFCTATNTWTAQGGSGGYNMTTSGLGYLCFSACIPNQGGSTVAATAMGGATGAFCQEFQQYYASASISSVTIVTGAADGTNYVGAFFYDSTGTLISGATATGIHPVAGNFVRLTTSVTFTNAPAFACFSFSGGTSNVTATDGSSFFPGALAPSTPRVFTIAGVSWSGATVTPPGTLGTRTGISSTGPVWAVGIP